MSIQKRNDQLVSLLRSDFVHRSDPVIADTDLASLSSPPTVIELSNLFGNAGDLSNGFTAYAIDSGTGTVYLVGVVGGSWFYTAMTLAL